MGGVFGLLAVTRRRGRVLAVAVAALSLAAGVAQSASAASRGAEARRVVSIARAVMREQHLAGMIVRVDRGNRQVVTAALGESMTGVPVTRDMRFRIGSESIPIHTTVLLQLQQEGHLDLDDPISKYLPSSGVPNADRVTLRMLGHSISGYPDWIQGNPAAPSRSCLPTRSGSGSDHELLDHAFAQPLICAPGACFHYAHTNFLPARPGGQRRHRQALPHARAPSKSWAVGAASHDDHAHREDARAGAARLRHRSRTV